jgi:hypothetical protein
VLEPYDGKLSCTVLRGERGGNAPDLPGGVQAKEVLEKIKCGYRFGNGFSVRIKLSW